jgi:hypothetical protein
VFWRVLVSSPCFDVLFQDFYWNTQNSFTVTMQLRKREMVWEVWMKSSQVVTGLLLLILPKFSWGMWRTSRLMCPLPSF